MNGISEFEYRVEEAAKLALIHYRRHMYLCITCRYLGAMDSPTRWQSICHNCGSPFSEEVKHVEPDFVLYVNPTVSGKFVVGRDKAGLLFIDGGVHDKYSLLIKDSYSRTVISNMGLPIFVLRNAEVGKPRHITKQKHDEFTPTQVTLAALRNMNLCALLLGFVKMIDNDFLYKHISSQEEEITGIGLRIGRKWIR